MTDWLVGTLAATSLLALLVLAIREPVRRLFGPSVAYALWLLPAGRAIFPSFTHTVERIVAPTPALTLGSGNEIPDVAAASTAFGLLPDWPALLMIAWLAGAGVMLARGWLIYRAQRSAILSDAVPQGAIGGVRIVSSRAVRGPVALGLIDRVIVLPLDFDRRFSERQRSLALDHELAHHRSGDLLANLIAYVLLCLQWFNPLAWAAHAAFRFDQEAACDARVLDKADDGDRASYGEAIAKAASCRSLLFAGALDQPSTLSRRLKIMTQSTRSRSRRTGLLLVGGAMLLALPLTATSAVRYADVAASPTVAAAAVFAPATSTSPVAGAASSAMPAAEAVKLAALAPAATATHSKGPRIIKDSDLSISEDSVTINGQRKRWEDLTQEERARVRAATAEARKSINEQIADLPKQMAELESTRAMFQNGDLQRQMIEARESVQKALAEIDGQSKILRATGQDPEKLKVDLHKTLAQLQQTNVDKMSRETLESIDPEKFRSQIMDAARSIDQIEARLNQLERR